MADLFEWMESEYQPKKHIINIQYIGYTLICISESEISIDPQAKHNLVLGRETHVGKHRGKMFLVVGHQVCAYLRRDSGPLLFTDTL